MFCLSVDSCFVRELTHVLLESWLMFCLRVDSCFVRELTHVLFESWLIFCFWADSCFTWELTCFVWKLTHVLMFWELTNWIWFESLCILNTFFKFSYIFLITRHPKVMLWKLVHEIRVVIISCMLRIIRCYNIFMTKLPGSL
jgi:hypothetical protein